ncbi:MAG: hypothetical protein HY879_20610 [Deltaproteobacteria bacterium]|nr:hypothetical protein [Deltaproteobacteria bacterium]
MMKKLGLIALVMGLVTALAMPVLAFSIDGAKGQKMYIGGLIQTDFGYWNRSKERTGAGEDNTQFITSVINSSRVRGSFEVGDVGGYWELGNGGEVQGATGEGVGTTNYIETRKLYGWYKFGNCEIRAGKDDGYLYTLVASPLMGLNNGFHVVGFGFGSVYDSRNPQVRFTQNVSKQFGYAVTLLQPDVKVDSTRTSYATLPTVAVKLNLNFGAISLYPAGLYQQIKWDKMPSGFDDTMTAWYGVLPVKVAVGGFTGIVQGGYGQNIAGPLALESAFQSYRRDAEGKVKNTTGVNAFVDLAYTFGPATPHLYFGYDNAKNSDVYGKLANSDDNNTRLMYGISIRYNVAPGFILSPEFTMYDYGKDPTKANKPDLGKEWLGGLTFLFVF